MKRAEAFELIQDMKTGIGLVGSVRPEDFWDNVYEYDFYQSMGTDITICLRVSKYISMVISLILRIAEFCNHGLAKI